MTRFATVAMTLLIVASAVPLQAQEDGVSVTVSVGPSFVNFAGFGGSFPAAVGQLRASGPSRGPFNTEVSLFALAPLGGATAVADCPPMVSCVSTTTPSLISGALISVYADAAETGLRMSLGGGRALASGGEGFDPRSSHALVVGLDWLPRTANRFAPTIAVRFVHLTSPIAGARQLLLPGLGLRF